MPDNYNLVSSHQLSSDYFRVWKNVYQVPGNKEKTYHVLKTPDAAIVLAITPDNQVVLVKQFRGGPGKMVVELPAGKIEKGEIPLQGARRELLEETGYTGDLEFVCTMSKGHNNTGLLQVFFCNNAHKIQPPQHTAFEEGMEVILQPLGEFIADLMDQNQIQNKPAAFAVLWKKGFRV